MVCNAVINNKTRGWGLECWSKNGQCKWSRAHTEGRSSGQCQILTGLVGMEVLVQSVNVSFALIFFFLFLLVCLLVFSFRFIIKVLFGIKPQEFTTANSQV